MAYVKMVFVMFTGGHTTDQSCELQCASLKLRELVAVPGDSIDTIDSILIHVRILESIAAQ